MAASSVIFLYLLIVFLVVLVLLHYKDKINQIGIDSGTPVEEKLDKNVIPTTRLWGIWGSIISGVGLIITAEFLSGIIVILVGISSTLGFVILLEGLSTIIKLLRKISDK
jgi:hypothetical protein